MKNELNRAQGMTLIELIIVVAIVAILGMIAYPNYSQYQQRAARLEAKNALELIATNQERFYISNFTYSSDVTQLGFATNETDTGLYVLNVPNATAQGYQATAVPAAGSRQVEDTDCQLFTINEQAVRAATPNVKGKCW